MVTKKDKLKAIIEKAKKNNPDFNDIDPWMNYDSYIPNAEFAILFDHDLAKAFFGEYEEREALDNPFYIGEKKERGVTREVINLGWQKHLQQCVISSNPIDYYYEHI